MQRTDVAVPDGQTVNGFAECAPGETFSFWKGTATNAAGGDTATRTMRVYAICAH